MHDRLHYLNLSFSFCITLRSVPLSASDFDLVKMKCYPRGVRSPTSGCGQWEEHPQRDDNGNSPLGRRRAALLTKRVCSPLFWSALLSLPVCGPINVALHSEDGDLRAPRSEAAYSWDHKAPKSAIFLLGNVGQILTEVSSNLAHLEAPFSTDCSVIALRRIRFRS